MRVVVNQLATLGRKTGVGHYAGQLLRALTESAGDDRVDTFPNGWVRRACKGFTRARPYLDNGHHPPVPRAAEPGALDRLRGHAIHCLRRGGRTVVGHYFRAVCACRKYDLYHEPNFIPFPVDCPTVTTIHDLSVLVHPEWHPADRVAFYEKNFQRSLKDSAHFLAVSEFTRQEMIRVLGVSPQRVTRTYNGTRSNLAPLPPTEVAPRLKELGFPPAYLLFVSTIEPRKNVGVLLRAYCSLPESVRSRWPLVLVGNWGWDTQDLAENFHREARHRGVIHHGYVPEKHLPAIYNGARALVYPSWYEGFGLPPVEMLACGGAVLASTAGALAETVGEQAHLIPPDDEDGWRSALLRVTEDDDWWRSLRVGATAAVRHFTWEQCARDTWEVFQSVAGKSAPPTRATLAAVPFPSRVAG